ncbi:hypothetical protein M441DRAFT_112040, partial [Trichoderma asperellum CBS 433.97]
DSNARANDGRTPLHTAVDYGHEEVIRNLVRHGAELDAKDEDGQTPLHIAAMKRPFPPPILQLLLDAGADAKEKMEGDITLAHITALNGSPNSLRLLLQRGADTNAADMLGRTPLHLAARNSHPECVSAL